MAISFIASADAAEGAGEVSSITFSINDSSCTGNNLAVAYCRWNSYSGATVGSATYDGAAMTNVVQRAGSGGSNANQNAVLFQKAGFAGSGSKNMVYTPSKATYVAGTVSLFSGVNTTTPCPDTASSTFENSSAPSQSVTTTVDNSWLTAFFINSAGGGGSAGANTTIRETTGSTYYSVDSNGAKTPTGAYTLALTGANAASDWVIVACSIAPSAGAAATNTLSSLALMGVGM